MSRITLRLAVATLTFVVSLTSVWFAGLLPRLESLVADLVAPNVTLEIAAPAAPDEADETNAVYVALVDRMLMFEDTEQVVIRAATSGFPVYEDDEMRKSFHVSDSGNELLWRTLPEAAPETLVDYLMKNKSSQHLSRIDGLKIRAVLVGEDDAKALFPEHEFDRAWTRFYAKYPNSSGLITVSRVGFNRRYDQAVVYVARNCGGLCGAGTYVLLVKKHGFWTIQNQAGVWVS